MSYPKPLQRILLGAEREVNVDLVLTRDNGDVETFKGARRRPTPALLLAPPEFADTSYFNKTQKKMLCSLPRAARQLARPV